MTFLRCILFASLGFALVGCDSKSTWPEPGSLEPDGLAITGQVQHTVFQYIDFRGTDQENVSWECPLSKNMTVLDLLLESGRNNDIKIEYSGAGKMAFVKSIGGVVGGAEGKDWWIFQVNDKVANVGAGAFLLKPDDQVEWRLGKYQQE